MKRQYMFMVVLALLLSLSLASPLAAQEEGVPPQVGLRPDAPTYALHGPYSVGTRDFVIDPEAEQPLKVTVWYPALNPDGSQESVTYIIGEDRPVQADMQGILPAGTPLVVYGHAIQDAAPAVTDAPYPLVVFSPGLTGWRQAYAYLAEHLASYGFVVITPDHHGETFEAFWEGAIGRQLEVNRSITFADELTADDGALAEVIDTQHIATTGHSSGGWTALTGGGAQMDFSWCAAHPDLVAQNPITDCNQFPAHQEELAAMAGLDSVPTGMWPAMNDPRVDAVIAMAPDGDIWGENYEGVAALTVPTMVMGGSGDTMNIPEITSYPIYEHLGSVNKAFVVFENADHMMFGTSCPDSPWLVEAGLSWVCADAVWDMDRAHDLVNHFTTAFLLDTLKGDEDAAAALAPENVQFPGIRYEATGF